MADLVQGTLTQESIQSIQTKIREIKAQLPFLISLSAPQKQQLPKMDNARKPFVEKALQYAEADQKFLPPYINVPELKVDLELYDQLQKVAKDLAILNEMVEDTVTAVSSDCYVTALSIYNSAKAASKVPLDGMDTIVNDLKGLFERTN